MPNPKNGRKKTVIPAPPVLDTFGKRLRHAREAELHLTGVAMAAQLGIPSQTLSTWEHGAIPTRPDVLTVCTMVETRFKIDRQWLAWGITGQYASINVAA